jgi:hypothetical protein
MPSELGVISSVVARFYSLLLALPEYDLRRILPIFYAPQNFSASKNMLV